MQQRGSSLLLPFGSLEIEFKLFSFKNITIEASTLSWAGGDASQEFSLVECVSQVGVDFAIGVSGLKFRQQVPAFFSFLDFSAFTCLLLVKLNIVVLEIPLSEGGCVNRNNSVLHESLGTDELVVCRVVDCVDNTGFASDGL